MKSFIIKAPAANKTTCSLVKQYYDKVARRTQTRYLGSFNVAVDPTVLPAGIRLRPGVELTSDQLEEIRVWLDLHGTFGQPPTLSAETLEQAYQYFVEVLHDERLHHQSALDVVASILVNATLDLEQQAANLREKGVLLSPGMLRYTGTDSSRCCNDMDHLKVLCNQIRLVAMAFEDALKDAHLMKRITRAKTLQAEETLY
jgi:hypothetical protein